ncbi:MAG TPA: hypothetical protein VGM76_02855 [Lacipirellulaceae bacterium]
MTSEEAESYIPLLAEELGFYPRQFVHKMKLARVVLCGQLFHSQCAKPVVKLFPGRAKAVRSRISFQRGFDGGFADARNGVVYLMIGTYDFDHLRKSIHHELYHCVQWRQFGTSGDREWSALNSPDFAYGPGGSAALHGPDRTFWVLPGEDWGHGFLNRYSMSAAEEDQAEIFAHLLTKPAQMEARASADEILQKKIERMKATLWQFCPEMDDAFWALVKESRLPFDL